MEKTPVLLLLFNRPKYTNFLIREIKKYSPTSIYIHCDGPRDGSALDKKKINLIKKIIKKKINWKCKKKIKFQEKNIGLRNACIAGIDFLFKNEKKGIILEDSMLPTKNFFEFCDTLLVKYKENKKVSLISGWNPISEYKIGESYTFSEHPKIWGWATWKRSWSLFDRNMNNWPKQKKIQWMKYKLKKPFFFKFYWEKIFDDSFLNKTKTWDYNMVYSNWCSNALSIVPKYNLIINQDLNAKELTTHKNNFIVKIKKKNLRFPLIHPYKIVANNNYDNIFYSKFYNFKFFFFNICLARIFKKIFKK